MKTRMGKIHAAVSDKFGVSSKSAGDGEGRRPANGVQTEFGITKASKGFADTHFSDVPVELEAALSGIKWRGDT